MPSQSQFRCAFHDQATTNRLRNEYPIDDLDRVHSQNMPTNPDDRVEWVRGIAEREAEVRFGRPDFFVAQMETESSLVWDAAGDFENGEPTSFGIPQIHNRFFHALSTEEELIRGIDWRWNPEIVITRAADYMRCLLDWHDGRWDLALTEYKDGASTVPLDKRLGGHWPYLSAITGGVLDEDQVRNGYTILDEPGSEPTLWDGSEVIESDGDEPGSEPGASESPARVSAYTVQAGDTLGEIAERLGVEVDVLRALNGIDDPNKITVGQVLTIPDSETPAPATAYTVQAGDELGEIAARNGVTLEDLRDANGLDQNDLVHPGDVLVIPRILEPQEEEEPQSETTYTVQDGDTLGGIAAHFAVDLEALQEANDIDDPDEIQVGQILIIPTVPGRVGEAPTGDQEALASRVPGSAGGDEDGNGETEEPAEPGAEGAESQIDKPRSGDVGIFVTRWEGSDLPSFTDPNGNPVQRGREAIFAWGGIQRRPVIEKGDGSYLTAGYAKDALWTTRRIAEANELGLNTADFWEARPDDIQGKINQAKLAIGQGKVPEAAAIDYATPRPPSSPDETEQLDRRARPGGLSPELMAQARREAWYRARYELAGPTNWTHYWDAAQRARGFKGLPKWMLDLESNWRVPPPEVMNPQAVPPAQYPPQGSFQTAPGPAPQYPPPGRPQPVPMPNRPQPGAIDPGIYARPGPQPGTGGAVPMPAYQPQYAQAPTPDPRVVERMRLAELAASQAAMPGVLKERAQQAWEDQRRRARKAAASRMSTDQR